MLRIRLQICFRNMQAPRIPGFRPAHGVSVWPDGRDEEAGRGGVPFGARVRKKFGRDVPNPLNRIGHAGLGPGFRGSGSG